MKDRFLAGGIAGAIAAIVQNIYGLIIKSIGLTDRSFENFSEIIITFKQYSGIGSFVVGTVAHTAVGIMFGVIFAYLTKKISSKYHIVKGLVYGLLLWFLLSGFGTVLRLPLFKNIPPKAALYDLVGALIYGFVLAYTLRVLNNQTKLL